MPWWRRFRDGYILSGWWPTQKLMTPTGEETHVKSWRIWPTTHVVDGPQKKSRFFLMDRVSDWTFCVMYPLSQL